MSDYEDDLRSLRRQVFDPDFPDADAQSEPRIGAHIVPGEGGQPSYPLSGNDDLMFARAFFAGEPLPVANEGS